MNYPLAPIAWGELMDKIIILEIKETKTDDHQVKKNIQNELSLLKKSVDEKMNDDEYLSSLRLQLKIVNQKIWDVEDALRQKEYNQCFDEEFISLARSVYQNNDIRASLKRNINIYLQSFLIEEKIYKTPRA